MIDHVAGKVTLSELSSACLGNIEGESIEHIDRLEELLDQPGDIDTLLAIARLRRAVGEGKKITLARIEELAEAIQTDIRTFRGLMEEPEEKKVA